MEFPGDEFRELGIAEFGETVSPFSTTSDFLVKGGGEGIFDHWVKVHKPTFEKRLRHPFERRIHPPFQLNLVVDRTFAAGIGRHGAVGADEAGDVVLIRAAALSSPSGQPCQDVSVAPLRSEDSTEPRSFVAVSQRDSSENFEELVEADFFAGIDDCSSNKIPWFVKDNRSPGRK